MPGTAFLPTAYFLSFPQKKSIKFTKNENCIFSLQFFIFFVYIERFFCPVPPSTWAASRAPFTLGVAMFDSLLPKSAPFFEMLIQQNSCLRSVAGHLVRMGEDPGHRDDALKTIALLEEKADHVYLRITRELSKTFITPIDREDLLRISQTQEEIIDNLQQLATRLHIYECSAVPFPAMQLLRTLEEMFALHNTMLEGLSRKRDAHKTRAFRSLRGDCDTLLSVGVAELMDAKELTPAALLEIIRWSQLYDRMEQVVTLVVKAAETIEEAVLKNV